MYFSNVLCYKLCYIFMFTGEKGSYREGTTSEFNIGEQCTYDSNIELFNFCVHLHVFEHL